MAVNGKSRRSYRGAPVSNTLGATLAAAATNITLAAAVSGWSTDGEPFFVVVDPGTAKEEKICVKYASSTTLTVVDPASTSTWSASVNGRGADNTVDREHLQGAVIYPVFTALEANQANELVSKYANAGSVVYQGSGTPGTFTELAIGTTAQVLRVNSGVPQWGQIATDSIADGSITTAKILDGTIIADDIANGAITSAKILDGTIVAGDIADGAITSAKILDGTIALADLAAAVANALVPVGTIVATARTTAPTGWLLCDGTSTTGYTALIALVGATTPDMRGKFPIGDNSTLTLLGTGGSATIVANNLPAHSHPNTATATVTVTDPGHSHTIDTYESFSGSGIGFVEPGSGVINATEADVVNTATTGITATSAVTMTNANNTTTAADYYPPYLVVNYIIKHD